MTAGLCLHPALRDPCEGAKSWCLGTLFGQSICPLVTRDATVGWSPQSVECPSCLPEVMDGQQGMLGILRAFRVSGCQRGQRCLVIHADHYPCGQPCGACGGAPVGLPDRQESFLNRVQLSVVDFRLRADSAMTRQELRAECFPF